MMALSKTQRGFALAATIIASSMGFIDGTIVHIALPAIQRDLGASFAALQWIANAYLLALCALLVISGALGDRYGSRRLFLIGIAAFTLSSVACAAAPDSLWLIAARTVQGVSAALMLPQSLSIIARLYTPEVRGRAVGIWSAASSASAAAGPVIGGLLVDNGGWPFAFWVNVPLGLLAFVITLYAVPKGSQRISVPLDWPGSVLLVLGLGAFVFATINLSLYPIETLWVWPGWVVGIVALLSFAFWERHAAGPILPAHLVANREFVLLNAYCLTVFVAFASVLFLVPYVLITSLELSASATALNMLPLGIFISLMARPVGAWSDRIGYRTPLLVSALGIAVATASTCLVVWLRTPWAGAVVMTLLGITMGLMVTPLTTGVLNSVSTDDSGLASGINTAVARIGHLLSITICGVVLALRYQHGLGDNLDKLVKSADFNRIELLLKEGAETIAQPDLSALPVELQVTATEVITRSLDGAFVEVMVAASLFALLAALCAVPMRKGPALQNAVE